MDTLIAYITLLALSAVFASLRGVGGGAAPLLAVGTVMVFFSFAVVAGVLVPAGWVFHLLVAGLLVLALVRRGRDVAKKLVSPGFLLFAAGGLLLLCTFALRQPVFSVWDEFGSWGLEVKLLKINGASYALADTGFLYTLTEACGLPVLGWFAQCFGAGFVQWKVYWAYDLLLLSCVGALVAGFELKRWRLWVPLAAAGLLLPHFVTVRYATVFLNTAWLTSYADLPAGLLFGGALVLYFAARAQDTPVWPAAVPLAALALVKENVVPVALVAAAVMAADGLFFGVGQPVLLARLGIGRPRGLPKGAAVVGTLPEPNLWWERPAQKAGARQWILRVAACAGWFAVPVASFMPWYMHKTAASKLNPVFAAAGGETNVPPVEAAVDALRQAVGLDGMGERMSRVLGELWVNFTGGTLVDGVVHPGTYKATMAGSPLATMALVLAVFAVALALAGSSRVRGRVAVACGLTTAGFGAYHFMLVVFWAFIERTDEGVIDYDRYLVSYTAGWLMLALTLLALCAVAGPEVAVQPAPGAEKTAGKRPLRPVLAQGGVLVLALFMVLRFAQMVRPGYSVVDYADSFYDKSRQRMAVAEALAEKIEPGGRVFFVCQDTGERGGQFFEYHFHLQPVVVDQSITGGWNLHPPEDPGLPEAETQLTPTPAALEGYLAEKGCDYILIDNLDAAFVENYGALFAGGLGDFPGEPCVYRRGADGLYALV